MTDTSTWQTVKAPAGRAPSMLKVRVQFNNGDYAKSMDCVADGIGNMNELLAALNTHRFVRLTMEGDMAPSLINAASITVVEEIGARLDGL